MVPPTSQNHGAEGCIEYLMICSLAAYISFNVYLGLFLNCFSVDILLIYYSLNELRPIKKVIRSRGFIIERKVVCKTRKIRRDLVQYQSHRINIWK